MGDGGNGNEWIHGKEEGQDEAKEGGAVDMRNDACSHVPVAFSIALLLLWEARSIGGQQHDPNSTHGGRRGMS